MMENHCERSRLSSSQALPSYASRTLPASRVSLHSSPGPERGHAVRTNKTNHGYFFRRVGFAEERNPDAGVHEYAFFHRDLSVIAENHTHFVHALPTPASSAQDRLFQKLLPAHES